MNREKLLTLLGPHSKRPIRAFLADKNAEEAQYAFWDLVYQDAKVVTHAQALEAQAVLESSPMRVDDVLRGWRPECLRPQERAA